METTINGGGISAPVAPGSTVPVSGTGFWECPSISCGIQQIVLGFRSLDHPGACVWEGTPGPYTPGSSEGAIQFWMDGNLTAPSTPGAYYVSFYVTTSSSCAEALKTTWPIDAPYIGVVAVR